MKKILACALFFVSSAVLAGHPDFMIVHNNTNEPGYAQNAQGKTPIVAPHTTAYIPWAVYQDLLCKGQVLCVGSIMGIKNGKAIEEGVVRLNVKNGQLKVLANENGYVQTVLGKGDIASGYAH